MFNDKDFDVEDYTDPQCPFCTDKYMKDPPKKRVPVDRIIDKADEYFSRNDYAGAERHFLFWLDEATAYGDERGQFSIYNELMGLYRKTGKKDEAVGSAGKAVDLIRQTGMEGSISAGTAYLNAGTVYKTFGLKKESLDCFEKAKIVYEKELKADDARLGGLYNNAALLLVDLGRFAEARENYEKALSVMKSTGKGELETAITYLNLVDLTAYEKGLEEGAEEIEDYFKKARALLDSPNVARNGYYAFVCDKCAGTFGYYGYFDYENELRKRAKEIYERA